MSYRYLNRLHFSVRLKNRPITRTAIFLNIRFFKPFDLRSFTSCDQLQNYHSVNLNFLNEKIVSAPQNTCNEFTEVSFTQDYSKLFRPKIVLITVDKCRENFLQNSNLAPTTCITLQCFLIV